MARRFAGGQRDITYLDRVALANRAVHLHRRKVELFYFPRSRIIAALEQRLVGFARNHLGSARLLQLGEAAGVIDMRVGIEEILDVGDFEAELLDARLDLRRCLRHHRIDQDMALRRRDQIGSETVGADIVDIVDDLERLGRLVPFHKEGSEHILGSLCLRCAHQRQQRDKRDGQFLHLHPLFFFTSLCRPAACPGLTIRLNEKCRLL